MGAINGILMGVYAVVEARPGLHLSKCQIIQNLMPRLIWLIVAGGG